MYPVNPFNPYPSVNPNYLQQANQSILHQQVTKVNGRNGAETYQMPPNSSALLLDESAPIVWLAQSDGAGYKTLTPYDIKPHEEVPLPDMKSLEERIAKIEEVLKNESNRTTNNRKNNSEYPRTNKADDSNN
jgi:hypothetical protein